MQRPPLASGFALLVQSGGDREGIRVELDNRVEGWTMSIDVLDAGAVFLHQ